VDQAGHQMDNAQVPAHNLPIKTELFAKITNRIFKSKPREFQFLWKMSEQLKRIGD
jgi:hypothetical protein